MSYSNVKIISQDIFAMLIPSVFALLPKRLTILNDHLLRIKCANDLTQQNLLAHYLIGSDIHKDDIDVQLASVNNILN